MNEIKKRLEKLENDLSHIREELGFIKGELSIVKLILGGLLASMILTLIGIFLK